MTMGEDDIDVDSGNELDNDELAGEGQEPSSGKGELRALAAASDAGRQQILPSAGAYASV